MMSDAALVFETHFKRSGNSAEGVLLVFPSLGFQKSLINQGKKWLSVSADTNTSKLETIIRRAPHDS